MNYEIKVIQMADDILGVMLIAERMSGKIQLFHTMLQIISKEDNEKWISYFVDEAKKIYINPKYEKLDTVKIKTNM